MSSSKRGKSKQGDEHGGGSKQGNLTFERTVKKSTFSTLTVPINLVHTHGDQMHKTVQIQSDEESAVWDVTLNVQMKKGEAQVKFGSGWKDFVASNCLREGDHLTFMLVDKSKFFVYITRRKEN